MPSHDHERRSNEAFDPEVALRRLDALIEAQLALVVNHSQLVALRDAWLGVAWLAERLPEDDGIVVSILNVTLSELHDDLTRPRRDQALNKHLVRDVYEDGRVLPWTVIAIHEPLTIGDEAVIEAMAELAEASSAVALLNGSPELVTGWSPPSRRERHRYAALLAPSIPQDGWSLPASHAALVSMAHSFTAYRHESNCVGPGGHVEVGPGIPTRTKEEGPSFARLRPRPRF